MLDVKIAVHLRKLPIRPNLKCWDQNKKTREY